MSQALQTQQNTEIGLTSAASFELAQRAAKALSSSSLVPKEYQGPAGMANCMVALNMAHRMHADPLMVMQNLVVIHGRPTWSSQFLIATFNSCGRYSSIKYEFFGDKSRDDYGCRAVATELSTGEKLIGPDVTIAIAKAEGWYSRNGSKWKTMPDQMLRYRAASWFVRTVAPELSMGLHTQEEVIDISDYQEVKPQSRPSRTIDDIIDHQSDGYDVVEADVIESEPPAADPYTDLKQEISNCQTLSDIARLLKDMPKEAKQDLKPLIEQRQAEINSQQNNS